MLEIFVCIVRQRGGGRDNPVPLEFMNAFKQASINTLLVSTKSANCVPDNNNAGIFKSDDVNSTLLGFMSQNSSSAISAKVVDPVIAVDDLSDSCLTSMIEENSFVYFSRHVLRRLLAKHTECSVCCKFVVGDQQMVVDDG